MVERCHLNLCWDRLLKLFYEFGEKKLFEDLHSLTREDDGCVGRPTVARFANLGIRDVCGWYVSRPQRHFVQICEVMYAPMSQMLDVTHIHPLIHFSLLQVI